MRYAFCHRDISRTTTSGCLPVASIELVIGSSDEEPKGRPNSQLAGTMLPQAPMRLRPDLIPLHWAATAGLVGDGIPEASNAMTAAEAWWSRRDELSP